SESAMHWAKVDPKLLVAGVNTVAVEVHQGSGSSSDISFDLELVANAQTTATSPKSALQVQSVSTGTSVSFQGEVGQVYRVQRSTDLNHWTNIGEVRNSTGPFNFVDPGPSAGGNGFYRALPQE